MKPSIIQISPISLMETGLVLQKYACSANQHHCIILWHDDVIKWKHFPRYWPFVRGIHRSPVNSPHKGQWRGALMFTLICARINGWVNTREAGDLRRCRTHYDVIILWEIISYTLTTHEHFVFEMCNRNLPTVNKSVAMAKMLWNLSKQSKDTVPKQGMLNRADRIP